MAEKEDGPDAKTTLKDAFKAALTEFREEETARIAEEKAKDTGDNEDTDKDKGPKRTQAERPNILKSLLGG